MARDDHVDRVRAWWQRDHPRKAFERPPGICAGELSAGEPQLTRDRRADDFPRNLAVCPCRPLERRAQPTRVVLREFPGTERRIDPLRPLARVSAELEQPDRKSTRLNSSHLGISYAVF